MTARINEHVHVARSPEQVFALLTDLRRLPEWTAAVTGTEGDTAPPLQAGRRFRQRVRILGVAFGLQAHVTAYEAPRTVEYEAEGPRGARATMRQTVVPEAEGCRLEIELEYDLPGGRAGGAVTQLFGGRANERVARVSLAAFKALAERELAPVPA